MRILQLIMTRQRRGAEVFATQLSDALSARGHDVTVLALYPPPADPLAALQASTIDLRVASRSRLSVTRLAGVLRQIEAVRPDVVQGNGSETLKYSALAKRVIGSQVPIIYRNISIASQWVRGAVHRAWGRWLASNIDHVTSVSEESSADFGRTYGVPAARRSVIHRGIVIPAAPPTTWARRRLEALAGVPERARLLIHVGAFTEEKNHAWLMNTFGAIHAERGDVHLILIGDGPLRPRVEARVREVGVDGFVHFLGTRSDAADLLAGGDLLVLPSRIEGIPGVVLEAAAQAVPTVATAVGGIREAVRHGETGSLVPPDDASAFRSAVLELLANDVRRHAMGRAARVLVQARFSMEATATEFETLYARLLEGAARQGRRVDRAASVATTISGPY